MGHQVWARGERRFTAAPSYPAIAKDYVLDSGASIHDRDIRPEITAAPRNNWAKTHRTLAG